LIDCELYFNYIHNQNKFTNNKSCSKKGCDRMVVGFTTTYAISAYHH